MRSRFLAFTGLLVVLVFMLWVAPPAHAAPNKENSAAGIITYKIYVVRRGDTLSQIAVHYGVSIRTLMRINNIRNANRIYTGQRLRIPVSGSSGGGSGSASGSSYRNYRIRRGDTLSGIASKFGVSVRTLQRVNHIRNPRIIYAGSVLRIPARGATSSPPPSGGGNGGGAHANASRWIEIDLSQQRLWAHQNNKVVFTTLVSTGIPGKRTPIGRFHVWAKVRRQTMSGPGYRLPNVQWVMYFFGQDAIHGTYWHHNFGHPMSHGCVNATNSAAKWLYNWSPSHVLVVVHQ